MQPKWGGGDFNNLTPNQLPTELSAHLAQLVGCWVIETQQNDHKTIQRYFVRFLQQDINHSTTNDENLLRTRVRCP